MLFFRRILRRRLEALLRPWLQHEPELELELGIINSKLALRNLRLSSSALNQLLDDDDNNKPSLFKFKDVSIEELSLSFSNWSVPAFKIEIRGVNVTVVLATDEMENRSSVRAKKSSEKVREEKKKAVAAIDPEGSAFHDVLERIFNSTSSRNGFTTSLMNLLIRHCHLQVFDTKLQVQVPVLHDDLVCLFELKEFNGKCQFFENGCLLRGFLGVVFNPKEDIDIAMNFRGFGIGYEMEDKKSVFCSTDLFSRIKLNNLQLEDFTIRVPELSLLLSPLDLLVFSVFGKLQTKESKYVRNGRQLWRLAANRLGYAVSSPRLSIHNLVEFVCMWIRYLNAYEYLLSHLEYSEINTLKRPTIERIREKVFLSAVKENWELISRTEKELPAEAIAQARRIARFKATFNARHNEENCKEFSIHSQLNVFSKILSLLAFIWIIIHRAFLLITRAFLSIKFYIREKKLDGNCGTVSEDHCPQYSFQLNFGQILINFSSSNTVQNVTQKLESRIGISLSDAYSFCLSLDAFLLVYVDEIFEQFLSISCGNLKAKLSSVSGDTVMQSSSKHHTAEVNGKRMTNNSVTVLWGEPAQIFSPVQTSQTNAAGPAESSCGPLLKKYLGEMWLTWRRACEKFDNNDIEFSEKPWLLFEIKNCLIHPGLKGPDSGFCKSNLTVGKLNSTIGYYSIIAMAVLLGETQHVIKLTKDSRRENVDSHPTQASEDQLEIRLEGKYEGSVSRMKMAFLGLFPEKCIQLGVFIAGPHLQMSMRKIGSNSGKKDKNYVVSKDDLDLRFDIQNIEAVVWPTLKSDLALTQLFDDDETECYRLHEPRLIEIPRSDNEKYASQMSVMLRSYLRVDGLIIYMGDSTEIQQRQIFVLKPVAIQSSFIRERIHSFSSTIIAFSAALCGKAAGFTVISYLDELHALFQVIADLFSAVSYAFDGFHINGHVSLQGFLRQHTLFSEPDNDETTAEGAPLILKSTICSVNGTFLFKSMDVILQSSRTSGKKESLTEVYDGLSHQNLPGQDLHDCGIWTSIHHTEVRMSYEEGKAEIHFNLLGFQSVIFRFQDLKGKRFDQLAVRNLLRDSHTWLSELSLSNLTLTLQISYPHERMSNSYSSSTSSDNITSIPENSNLSTDPEISDQSSMVENIGISAPTPSHWILVSVSLGGIFVARRLLKNIVVGAHQLSELSSLLSIEGNLKKISWKIQGGHLFLEITALTMLVRCFSSYMHRLSNLLFLMKSSVEQVENAEYEAQGIVHVTEHPGSELPEMSSIDLCQFSLILAVEDDTGGFQELASELDACVEFESTNLQNKFMFKLSRMSIFSQFFQECAENQFPHFSSGMSKELSSQQTQSSTGDPCVPFQHMDGSHISHRNYILNNLVALISAEKSRICPLPSNQVWSGNGSVSGFHVTVSLSEIQMLLSMVSSVSSEHNEDTTGERRIWKGDQRSGTISREADKSLADTVPDGAIVAIQDVHQHLYFTVEGGENKYNLVGMIHYSLVGEKALFRVKHHKQKKWNSSVVWFSLISLHAKNDRGQPFRLSYRPGSGFVDISSAGDSGCFLWKIFSCEPDSYEGDTNWEPSNNMVKNKFYLVNKKNDSGIAFVEGTPEFVRKPGNPIKFKVFPEHVVGCNVTTSDRYYLEASGENLLPSAHEEGVQTSIKLPCIQIEIDYSDLTIVYELPDAKDRFPLLRAFINNSQIIVQNLSFKTRVMTTSCAFLHYFDAQRNSWRELLNPVELCTFYRSSSQFQGSRFHQDQIPVHLYCRTKKLDISLTELSLDILLFVIGELKLAGPFSVKSSAILANCCKVENHSCLNLLCHFHNNKSVTVASKQSASVFLRLPVSASEPPEGASSVAIQLSNLESFTTSELQFCLSKTQTIAWRTRILSLSDSRSYPGPFVVIDICRKTKDGLSIEVSPLTRIQNGTDFPLELRFRRPQQNADVFASVLLKKGDSFDDSMATFDAINLSGGLKKALMSFSVGNFLFSFRPEIADGLLSSKSVLSVEWTDELKGGKAVRLSGIFDRLGYKVRRALSVKSEKCSFSTACCTLRSEDTHVTNLHFLIQSLGRDVPMVHPDKSSDGSESKNSPIALQDQKEIFLLPTVRVSNLLHSEIHVLLTETDRHTTNDYENIGKQATIACGSTADFYANPAVIYFTVSLTAFRSSCKPVNSGDWIKKLLKKKNDVNYLDIDLEFCGGKYFASLRLSRGFRGILEAAIFTPFSLRNNTDFSLFFLASNQKLLSRDEVGKYGPSIPPELGLYSPPKSTNSWFYKSHKMRITMVENQTSEVLLDLDALSGLAEISLEIEEGSGPKYSTKFGVSMGPSSSMVMVPSQTVTMTPRHVVFNESEESINMRQCYLEDGMTGMIQINSKEQTALRLLEGNSTIKEFSFFENIIRKHRNDTDTSSVYIQFQLNQPESTWSGPVSIASLGCFFVKFRKQSNQALNENATEFAAVHVIEEGSTLGMHFHKPSNIELPYQIENHLNDASFTYYQKDSSEREVLGSDSSSFYVWTDLTLPHKLVVVLNDLHLLREINLDKIRPWKPFLKGKHRGGLTSHSLFNQISGNQKKDSGQLNSMNIAKVGYEIYAQGPTRVLRICELSRSQKGHKLIQSRAKMQLRVLHFAIHLLEDGKQDLEKNEEACYTPLIVARFGNIDLDSVYTDRQKYNQITVQSLNVDEKWVGAPFAAMLRRHQLESSNANAYVLKFIFVLLSSSSSVRQVEYSSVVLQPIDLNLDEETLIRLASFWRTSLSKSTAPSQRYYFDHFEAHPIKIIANFLPGDSYSSYDSAQETLRSLLHSVVKVPPIKNMVVELNGVLVTHALITIRELFFRCAQHYSWYAMRAIYIAKGSLLLPPSFVSMFDDLASSSLDVYFDPSRGLINLPGFTLGTFKLLSRCIDGKGFSGTKRYFGDLEKTLKTVGSNMLFAAVTEISDSILKGAETSGFDGLLSGFNQGIMKLAMEPSLLGSALMEGGPDRKIKLDRSPGIDELYIEGYLQAMLDTMYRQEYLRVRVIDDQVLLKNLPPSSTLIDEITDHVKGFLVSRALLKGDPSASSRHLRHLRGETEWKIVPTVITLCEHLFVSFAIRTLRKQSGKLMTNIKWRKESTIDDGKAIVPADTDEHDHKVKVVWKWGIGKFIFSAILAYIDGRLCRGIPNPVARRIVSGYLLSFLDKNDT
ncbi:uncharacterized protein LOC126656072 [Mercurialis annua]|uniref:uncharacterized protein LOC126656072 n=1 Tax=Mercurialis annua TaxID=3986 RepID=UPI00215ED0B4|nr:uncharacterized protein LOC126656072 [Mercurialis annua]